jgi:alkanesulfonate monooxygenase SsuD/methylene tetrahydromethanopterin reductase-like flavin-dependent oxidoreductase (luciferase family)
VAAARSARLSSTARFATEYNTIATDIPTSRERFERVARAAESIGRDPATLRLSAGLPVITGATRAEVIERARRIDEDPDVAAADGGQAIGTPAEVIDTIAGFAGLGVARVYLQFWNLRDLDQLELVGTDVLPHLP